MKRKKEELRQQDEASDIYKAAKQDAVRKRDEMTIRSTQCEQRWRDRKQQVLREVKVCGIRRK